MRKIVALASVAGLTALAAPNFAVGAIYLNDQNMTVMLGSTMAPNPFANRTTAASLASVIDAPSASAFELHNQLTHVWVSGGNLELVFDLATEYDLNTFHFWNYHSEGFDVDDIDLTFFDASNNLVGSLLNITPALGGSSGSDTTQIFAQNLALSFPSKVRYVNAVLSGTNNQVDFNNIGFTGEISINAIPEPETYALLLAGLGLLGFAARRRLQGKA